MPASVELGSVGVSVGFVAVVTVTDLVNVCGAPAAFVPKSTIVWVPVAAEGIVTVTDTDPVELAVPTPRVVGVEYMPAVTAEFGANPEPVRTTVPPATGAVLTPKAPFEAGSVGGNCGADTTSSTIAVAVGTQVVSTIDPEPTSLKITLLTVTFVGAPETVPVIVAPGAFARAGIAPYRGPFTATDVEPAKIVPVGCNQPFCSATGPFFGPSVNVTLTAVPVTDADHVVVHGNVVVIVVQLSVPDIAPGGGVEVVVGDGDVVVGLGDGEVVVGDGDALVDVGEGEGEPVPAATVIVSVIGVVTGVVYGFAPGLAFCAVCELHAVTAVIAPTVPVNLIVSTAIDVDPAVGKARYP